MPVSTAAGTAALPFPAWPWYLAFLGGGPKATGSFKVDKGVDLCWFTGDGVPGVFFPLPTQPAYCHDDVVSLQETKCHFDLVLLRTTWLMPLKSPRQLSFCPDFSGCHPPVAKDLSPFMLGYDVHPY